MGNGVHLANGGDADLRSLPLPALAFVPAKGRLASLQSLSSSSSSIEVAAPGVWMAWYELRQRNVPRASPSHKRLREHKEGENHVFPLDQVITPYCGYLLIPQKGGMTEHSPLYSAPGDVAFCKYHQHTCSLRHINKMTLLVWIVHDGPPSRIVFLTMNIPFALGTKASKKKEDHA